MFRIDVEIEGIFNLTQESVVASSTSYKRKK